MSSSGFSFVDSAAADQVSEGLEQLAAAAFTYRGSSSSRDGDSGSQTSTLLSGSSETRYSENFLKESQDDEQQGRRGQELMPLACCLDECLDWGKEDRMSCPPDLPRVICSRAQPARIPCSQLWSSSNYWGLCSTSDISASIAAGDDGADNDVPTQLRALLRVSQAAETSPQRDSPDPRASKVDVVGEDNEVIRRPLFPAIEPPNHRRTTSTLSSLMDSILEDSRVADTYGEGSGDESPQTVTAESLWRASAGEDTSSSSLSRDLSDISDDTLSTRSSGSGTTGSTMSPAVRRTPSSMPMVMAGQDPYGKAPSRPGAPVVSAIRPR